MARFKLVPLMVAVAVVALYAFAYHAGVERLEREARARRDVAARPDGWCIRLADRPGWDSSHDQ
jgi:hypothetical protein